MQVVLETDEKYLIVVNAKGEPFVPEEANIWKIAKLKSIKITKN